MANLEWHIISRATPRSRLPKRSWVKISQILTLSTERIGKKTENSGSEESAYGLEGLNEIIGG
jgi:mRNA interferase MazF